jgi:transposase
MPEARDYHLQEQQVVEIEKAIRHDKRPKERQRCRVIRLLHLDYKPEEIAKMQAISIPAAYGWLKRWQREGTEKLANKAKSGRPAKADDAYNQALVRVLEQEPKEFGYDFAIWTVERLRQHLEKETGIALSEPRLRALMKRKGDRYRRSKHNLGHLQDKQAKAQMAELLEELKKGPRRRFRAHLCGRNDPDPGSAAASLLDEVRRTKTGTCNQSWFKTNRHGFGGYNWAKDTITWTTALVKSSVTFIQFLEALLVKEYPTGRVVFVLDNVSYHKSASA